jgi:hypothetical protein
MTGLTVLAGIARIYVLAHFEYPGTIAIHWPFLLLDVDVTARYLLLMIRPVGQAIFHSVALPSVPIARRSRRGVPAALAYGCGIQRLPRSAQAVLVRAAIHRQC